MVNHRSLPSRRRLPFEAPAIDPSLLVARTGGVIEWLCPACARLDRTLPTKNGRLLCRHPTCRRTFLVGFCLTAQVELPPFSGRYDPKALVRTSHNLPDPRDLPPGRTLARCAGPLEWRCPSCTSWNYQYPTWELARVLCEHCFLVRHVVVVLRAAAPYRVTAPLDWVSHVEKHLSDRQRLDALRRCTRSAGPTGVPAGRADVGAQHEEFEVGLIDPTTGGRSG